MERPIRKTIDHTSDTRKDQQTASAQQLSANHDKSPSSIQPSAVAYKKIVYGVLGIHLLLLISIIGIRMSSPQIVDHTFTLVDICPEAQPSLNPTERVSIEAPIIEHPIQPDLPVPEQPPAPQPITQAPIPVKSQPPPPATTQKISHQDFLKTQKKPQAPKAQKNIPTGTKAKQDLHDILTSTQQSKPTHQSKPSLQEMSGFKNRLRKKIDAAWNKPTGSQAQQLSAQVEFVVTASGTIEQLRIISSSGNEAFDRSILKAFNQIHTVEQPPGGQKNTFQLTFKSAD